VILFAEDVEVPTFSLLIRNWFRGNPAAPVVIAFSNI